MPAKLSDQTLTDGLTPIVSFTYPDEANRLANTNRTPSTITLAIDKVVRQVDTGQLFVVAGIGPLVWRELSQPADEGYVEATGTSTTSATLEDIAGCTFDLTMTQPCRIHAEMTFANSTAGGSPATGAWAISINSVDGTELPRYLSGSNDNGIGAVQTRSGVLGPGTYTVKGRHRRVSGSSTVNTDVAQLFALCVAP
jgi:hypothetical protein